jgi:hypothetical protein
MSWTAPQTFTDIDTDYGDETVTSTWNFIDNGTGAFGTYDIKIGDVGTPDYGGIQLGQVGIYSSSFATGNIDLGGTLVFRQEAAVSGILEFAWIEGGNTIRAGIPESAAGNATNFMRSFMIAGPYSAATGDNHFICDTHTAYNTNIDCDTGTSGADMFVQDDLEVEGTLFLHETIKLDADDINQLTISATSQTASHTFDFPDDEIVDDDVLLGDAAGSFSYVNVPDCNTNNMLTYTAATNTFGCDADDGAGAGEANVLASPDLGAEVDLINSVSKTGVALNLVSLEADDFTATSNIITIDDVDNLAAGAVDALTEIGDLCAGNEILERNAGDTAWACISTPGGGGGGSDFLGFSGESVTVSKGVTNYLGVSGGNASTTEANAAFYAPAACTLQNLRTYVSTNSTGADGSTITVRLNIANCNSTALQVTYDTGVTGLQSDTTGTCSVVAADRIDFQVINAGSGGGTKDLVVESISVECAF